MSVAEPVVEVALAAMGTVFAAQVADPAGRRSADRLRADAEAILRIAADVERHCSRFDPTSELSQLCATVDEPRAVSALLLELVALALAVAEASDGAFDPTVGRAMAQRGFDRQWRTDVPHPVAPPTAATWRDVVVDRPAHTIRLTRPLLLDLGAIAKGFAVDLMATALPDGLTGSLYAGGDVRCVGAHPDGRPWAIGIRHPLAPDTLIATAHLPEGAVCTSGGYARETAPGAHHLLDPRTRRPARGFASVTVVAPTAVVADALATAAFVMGPDTAAAWLAAQGVDALLVTPSGAGHTVAGAGVTGWQYPPSAP